MHLLEVNRVQPRHLMKPDGSERTCGTLARSSSGTAFAAQLVRRRRVYEMSHSIAETHFHNTRSQTVIQKLREMILSGELISGIRLHEVPLSENLQVSRTPVRDALSVLAHEGLLDYRPNRGYVVKRFGLQ